MSEPVHPERVIRLERCEACGWLTERRFEGHAMCSRCQGVK